MASLNQPRVGQTLAVYGFDEAVETVQRVNLHITLVQAKGEFVHIAVKMLRAGVVVDAIHPTLHDRPNTFNGVGVHITPAVLPGAMVYRLMPEKEAANSSVAGRFICHELGADFNVIEDRTLQALFVCVRDGISDGATAPLPESDNGCLANRSATGPEFLGFVFVGLFAAEKGFIGFDYALQFGEFTAASLTQAVEHEPCRFLLDADFLGDLHGRDALAGGDEQIHRIQPLIERDMRPLEDSASADRKVKLAFVAAVKASLAWRDAVLTGTGWAGDTFRPKAALKVDAGCFLVREHLEELESADSRSAHGGRLSAGLRTGPGCQARRTAYPRKRARRSLCNQVRDGIDTSYDPLPAGIGIVLLGDIADAKYRGDDGKVWPVEGRVGNRQDVIKAG